MKKKLLKLLAVMTISITALFALGITASAATAGDFTITLTEGGGDPAVFDDYAYAGGVLTIYTSTPLTIKNTTPSTPTTDRIEVALGVSANITLAGVNIDVSSQSNTAAFKIADNSTGNVTITLADGTTNTLKSGDICAGLQKNGEYSETLGKLTITGTGALTAQGGDLGAGIGGSYIEISGGKVTATGSSNGAGIGGGSSGSADNIKISGGEVTATGGGYGAGIGGGYNGSGSYITISGGTVTATGGHEGAGIGGGWSGNGSNIEISGGEVTATGGEEAAGIGGGFKGNGSNIEISGGTVEAQGDEGGTGGAGIGGGFEGSADNIKISGGVVTATGGEGGAGIGGGKSGSGSYIEISGGVVTATGGIGSAGIGGGGYSGSGSYITISGGKVTATGGDEGAGIGGGSGGSGSYIEISGGVVTATGGEDGAGIGGGYKGSGSNIKISGGTVEAQGGESGAGIGGGEDGSGSYITISDGTLTAIGGEEGAGIGGGFESDGSNITIEGGTVTATGGDYGAGIGGGDYNGSGSYIEISGGTVTATGGCYAAGIGGGWSGSGSDITISGGTITATGGTSGAGIGGGDRGSADNITISGGSVKAVAGTVYQNCVPAAIGQGVQYNESTSVYSDGAEVTPTDGTDNVYLLELDVDGTSAVTANGKAYPKKHFDENKLYVYLPAKTAQAPNEVTVGNETTKYCYINAKWLKVVDSPTFTPTSGTTFTSTQNVTIACATDGATIYYTTDGSTPTTASTKYTGAITITSTTTIKAIAVKDGMGDSSVVTAEYTKNSSSSGGSGGGSGGSGDSGGGSSSSSKESPNIEGKNGKKGWSAILDVIEDTKEGEKVVIDMNDATELPKNILSEIKGKDIAIVLNMDNGFIWTINGKDVENPKTIDMGVKKGTRIPVKVINEVTGESEYIEITLSHNGDFGFKAVLTVDMGKNNKGNFANLYYYNKFEEETEIVSSDEIDENGKADLTFTHASEYVIVIDDTDHTDLSAGESIKVEEIVLL